MEQVERKKLVRRTGPDGSQRMRRWVQAGFAALNLWLGIEFCLWVRAMEQDTSAGSRPPGVEGWLPIAGLMNAKYFFTTGSVPRIHPAAMVLFLSFVAMSLLLKKAFCSWLCPVGTFSELLGDLGNKLFGRTVILPRWLDIPLRGLKYLLLGFFAVLIGSMSAEGIRQFMETGYGLVADVKMLNFFRTLSLTGGIVLVLLIVLSMVVRNFWCRYLCPYGALLGLVSLASPVKIRRDAEACVDCGGCARSCPAALPVDKLIQIRSVECTGCMECVAACPAEGALQFSLAPRKGLSLTERWRGRKLGPVAVVGILALLFLVPVALARATGHWQTNLPESIYRELVPHVGELSHPGR
jgi:polyferredoxin